MQKVFFFVSCINIWTHAGFFLQGWAGSSRPVWSQRFFCEFCSLPVSINQTLCLIPFFFSYGKVFKLHFLNCFTFAKTGTFAIFFSLFALWLNVTRLLHLILSIFWNQNGHFCENVSLVGLLQGNVGPVGTVGLPGPPGLQVNLLVWIGC